MAERPSENQDYLNRFHRIYPKFEEHIGHPQMGAGGADVYKMYGYTNDDKKFNFSFDQSGKLMLNSDGTIEIVAGEKSSPKNEDILIHSRRGNVTITADRTGNVRISGTHVIIKGDGDLEFIAGNDMKFTAANITFEANAMNTSALTGNMIPFSETWMAKIYSGTYVGADVVAEFLGRFIGAS